METREITHHLSAADIGEMIAKNIRDYHIVKGDDVELVLNPEFRVDWEGQIVNGADVKVILADGDSRL